MAGEPPKLDNLLHSLDEQEQATAPGSPDFARKLIKMNPALRTPGLNTDQAAADLVGKMRDARNAARDKKAAAAPATTPALASVAAPASLVDCLAGVQKWLGDEQQRVATELATLNQQMAALQAKQVELTGHAQQLQTTACDRFIDDLLRLDPNMISPKTALLLKSETKFLQQIGFQHRTRSAARKETLTRSPFMEIKNSTRPTVDPTPNPAKTTAKVVAELPVVALETNFDTLSARGVLGPVVAVDDSLPTFNPSSAELAQTFSKLAASIDASLSNQPIAKSAELDLAALEKGVAAPVPARRLAEAFRQQNSEHATTAQKQEAKTYVSLLQLQLAHSAILRTQLTATQHAALAPLKKQLKQAVANLPSDSEDQDASDTSQVVLPGPTLVKLETALAAAKSSFAGMDIDSLVETVLAECADEDDKDLEDVIQQLQKNTAQKQLVRNYETQAKQAQAKAKAEVDEEYQDQVAAGAIDPTLVTMTQYENQRQLSVTLGDPSDPANAPPPSAGVFGPPPDLSSGAGTTGGTSLTPVGAGDADLAAFQQANPTIDATTAASIVSAARAYGMSDDSMLALYNLSQKAASTEKGSAISNPYWPGPGAFPAFLTAAPPAGLGLPDMSATPPPKAPSLSDIQTAANNYVATAQSWGTTTIPDNVKSQIQALVDAYIVSMMRDQAAGVPATPTYTSQEFKTLIGRLTGGTSDPNALNELQALKDALGPLKNVAVSDLITQDVQAELAAMSNAVSGEPAGGETSAATGLGEASGNMMSDKDHNPGGGPGGGSSGGVGNPAKDAVWNLLQNVKEAVPSRFANLETPTTPKASQVYTNEKGEVTGLVGWTNLFTGASSPTLAARGSEDADAATAAGGTASQPDAGECAQVASTLQISKQTVLSLFAIYQQALQSKKAPWAMSPPLTFSAFLQAAPPPGMGLDFTADSDKRANIADKVDGYLATRSGDSTDPTFSDPKWAIKVRITTTGIATNSAGPVEPNGATTMTLAELGAAIQDWDDQNSALGDISEQLQMKVQLAQDNRSKCYDTISNIMKKSGDTAEDIIDNLKV